MTQIVRYTGTTKFRMVNLGIEVSPQDPLHEVDDDVAQHLIDNYDFEAYSGTETNVPTTLLSTFVDGEDINPTSIGTDNAADVAYTDETKTDMLSRSFGRVASNGSSASFYFHNPQAVHRNGSTYITYRGGDAGAYIVQYDHESRDWSESVKVGDTTESPQDEHDVPALAIDGDGYLYLLYGAHDDPLIFSRSQEPYSVTDGFTRRTATEIPAGTYTNMANVGNTVYSLYRSGTQGPNSEAYPSHAYAALVRTTDRGSTWTDVPSGAPAIDTSDHPAEYSDAYVGDLMAADGKLHATWTVANGTDHNDSRDNVYHAVFDPTDDNWYTIDGSLLGGAITWADHPDCEAATHTNLSRVAHTVESDGTPHLVYTDGIAADSQHKYVTYQNGSWSEQQVATLETDYNGFCRIKLTEDGQPEVWAQGYDASGSTAVWRARLVGGDWETEQYGSGLVSKNVTVVRGGTDDFAGLYSPQPIGYPAVNPNQPTPIFGLPKVPDNARAGTPFPDVIRNPKHYESSDDIPGNIELLSWSGDGFILGDLVGLRMMGDGSLYFGNAKGDNISLRINETTAHRFYDDGGFEIFESRDLGSISAADGRMYRHDGSSSINADGGTTSSEGYYVYSSGDGEFKSVAQF